MKTFWTIVGEQAEHSSNTMELERQLKALKRQDNVVFIEIGLEVLSAFNAHHNCRYPNDDVLLSNIGKAVCQAYPIVEPLSAMAVAIQDT